MKTGIFVRFERNKEWQSLDVADLSEKEFATFIESQEGREGVWARGLHKWIIESVNFEND